MIPTVWGSGWVNELSTAGGQFLSNVKIHAYDGRGQGTIIIIMTARDVTLLFRWDVMINGDGLHPPTEGYTEWHIVVITALKVWNDLSADHDANGEDEFVKYADGTISFLFIALS